MERTACTACGGTRFTPSSDGRKMCWKCQGHGYVDHIAVTCNRCHGNGKLDRGLGEEPMRCPTCDGEGTVREPGR